jgi:penicillin-binding protein-related factor A (putative recombinase)
MMMMMMMKKKKTCQSSIKQTTQHKGEEKGTRWKDPSLSQVNEHQITYLRSEDEDSSSLLLLAKQNSHTKYLHKPCDHHTKNLMTVPTQAFLIITVSPQFCDEVAQVAIIHTYI